MAAELAMFPWEDIDLMVRAQAEAEIWSDAEYDAWLAELDADRLATIDGSDLMYERWLAEGAPSVAGQWSLLDGAMEVLPEWDRDDWIGS